MLNVLKLLLVGASLLQICLAAAVFPAIPGIVDFDVGDFNSDSRTDFAVATKTGIIIVLQDFGGKFDTPITAYSTHGIVSLWAADFNNDKILDIMGIDVNGDTILILGKGDGTFQASENIMTTSKTTDLVCKDFDNNGYIDCAVLKAAKPFGFQIASNTANTWTIEPITTLDNITSPFTMAAGDFAGKNMPDLIIGSGGFLQIWKNFGIGMVSLNFGQPQISVVTVDFNNDKMIDLATVSSTGVIIVLIGNGNRQFTPASPITLSGPVVKIVATDFNNDGKQDLAALMTKANQVFIMLGNGDGTFGTPFSATYTPTGTPVTMLYSDINMDGTMDLTVGLTSTNAATGQLAVLYASNGTFSENVPACTKVSVYTTYNQRSYGQTCQLNNAGCVADSAFQSCLPSGLTVGCAGTNATSGPFHMTISSSTNLRNYEPEYTNPAVFTQNYQNPTSTPAGGLAGELTAMEMSMTNDVCLLKSANSCGPLSALLICSSGVAPIVETGVFYSCQPFYGWTIQKLFQTGNNALGGCGICAGNSNSTNCNPTILTRCLYLVNDAFNGGKTLQAATLADTKFSEAATC